MQPNNSCLGAKSNVSGLQETTLFKKAFLPVSHLKEIIQKRSALNLGWPTCVLHTKPQQEDRPNIPGTLSLFVNVCGKSMVSLGKRNLNVDEGTFLVSNNQQAYSLTIDDPEAETFNVHFGTQLLQETLSSFMQPIGFSLENLDQPFTAQHHQFANHLQPRSVLMQQYFARLAQLEKMGRPDEAESVLQDLMLHLFAQEKKVTEKIARVPATRNATKKEIYHRLNLGMDFLYSNLDQEVKLDDMANVAMLSKFHFLRLFKEVFGLSPHQYLIQQRLNRSIDLLKNTSLGVGEIALKVGFENVSSFSRLFAQRIQMRPLACRRQLA